MTCIRGLGNNVVDYVITYIPLYNQIVNFDLINDHELDSYHRNLTLIINWFMHKISIEENSNNQRHLHFEKNKADFFLKHLNSELNFVSYKNNVEDLYHNFMITLSTFINKLSIEAVYKKEK